MQNRWLLALGASVAVGAGLMLVGSRSEAADHIDAPGSTADTSADINDLYVFRSKDPAAGTEKRTVFIMTVNPLATAATRFSDKVDYEIRIQDQAAGTSNATIKCTADAGTPQKITCALGSTTQTVDFNGQAGAATDDMRLFAGLRDDPFFIDLDEIKTVLGDPTKVALLTDSTGKDFLAGANTLALVVDVKNTVLKAAVGGNNVLRVHAVTTRTGN